MAKLDTTAIVKALGELPADRFAQVMGALPKLLEGLPAVLALLEMIGPLVRKRAEPVLEFVPPPGDFPDAPINNQPVEVPKPILRELGITLQWVNGSPHSLADAVGWGSYIRFDVNHTADQFGHTLAEADLPHPVEWFWSWDGVKGGGPINKGSNAYNEANGYACAFRIYKAHEDAERHVFAVWCSVAGVESNEISLSVD